MNEKELIKYAEDKEREFKELETRALYASCSNNAVEALNRLPYITEGTWFDQDFSKIKVKDGKVSGYFHLIGDYEYTIEEFLKSFQEEIDNIEIDETLLSFYEKDENKDWKKLDSDHSLINCQHHRELWKRISTDTNYIVSVSHWQGEHLSEDDFEETDQNEL